MAHPIGTARHPDDLALRVERLSVLSTLRWAEQHETPTSTGRLRAFADHLHTDCAPITPRLPPGLRDRRLKDLSALERVGSTASIVKNTGPLRHQLRHALLEPHPDARPRFTRQNWDIDPPQE